MPLVMKKENDPDCGYVPPVEPIYRWYSLPIYADYICDECPVYKLVAMYGVGNTHEIVCDDNTTLSRSDVRSGDYSYSAMTSAAIGNCITSIGNVAFDGCISLASINIPTSVTTIGQYAFSDCSSLTSISIPDSVTSIGQGAFINCSGLTSCTIGSGVTSIDNDAFMNCRSLTSINIPNSVTSISSYAFAYCRSLTSVTIPNSVTIIGAYAFTYCTSLTSIDIPDSVTSIGDSAFEGCSGMTTCTIGSGVTSIDNRAFNICTGLTSITVEATTPPTLGVSAFYGSTCPIYIPCESISLYKSASGWSNYAERIRGCSEQYRTTSGTPYCSGETGYDKYVDIYSQVSYDGGSTWETTATTPTLVEAQSVDCGYIPPGNKFVATYNNGTSYSAACDSNTSLTTDDTKPAGYTYSAMTSAYIGDYCITSIGSDTFRDCTSLTSIDIPNNVTSIGERVFQYCSSLTSCTIGSGITSIAGAAFDSCTSLTSIDIPNSVTSIGEAAFMYCTGLTSIDIPNSVTSIGDFVFYGCRSLTSVTVNATTPPTLGGSAFDGSTCPILVPAQSVETYKSATNWSSLASRIQAIP